MKKLNILFLSFFIMILSSCAIDFTPGVMFNEKEFLENKKRWTENCPTTYSFNYDFTTWRVGFVKGSVIISDEKESTYAIMNEPYEENGTYYDYKILDEASNYYLSNMTSVFDMIWNNYKKSVELCKTCKYKVEYTIKYESNFGYPIYADSTITDKNGFVTSEDRFSFRIRNFSLNEDENP